MYITLFGYKLNLQILVLIGIMYLVIIGSTVCGCCNTNIKDGMTTVTNMLGSSFAENQKLMEGFGAPYTIGGSSSIDTSTWVSPDLSNVESPASQDILNRPEQPVPLPEGRMSFFGSTKFSPECCPNAYSTSSGCACMTMNQYNSLRNRGGNTDSLSEF
jgi:hypothetical protein